jgi:hypothetical protein
MTLEPDIQPQCVGGAESGSRYRQMARAVLRSGRRDLALGVATGDLSIRQAYRALRPPRDEGLHMLRRGWKMATADERARFRAEIDSAAARACEASC